MENHLATFVLAIIMLQFLLDSEQAVVSLQGILFQGTNLPMHAQAKTAYNNFLVTVKKVITARMAGKHSTVHGFLMCS